MGHAQIAIGFNNNRIPFRGDNMYEPFLVIRRGPGSDKLNPQPADKEQLRAEVQRLHTELQQLQQELDERCTSMYGYRPLHDALQEHQKAIDGLRSAKAGAHADTALSLLFDRRDECEWRLDRFLRRDPKTSSLAGKRRQLQEEYRAAQQAHADADERSQSNLEHAALLLHAHGLVGLMANEGFQDRIQRGQLTLNVLEEQPHCDERGIPLVHDTKGVAHPCDERLIIPAVFATNMLESNGFRTSEDKRYFWYRLHSASPAIVGEWKRPAGKPMGHAIILRPYEVETFQESLAFFLRKQDHGENALEFQMGCYPRTPPEAPAASG